MCLGKGYPEHLLLRFDQPHGFGSDGLFKSVIILLKICGRVFARFFGRRKFGGADTTPFGQHSTT